MSELTAQADGKLRSRAQGHGGQGVSAPLPAPQNNQLQELPYNELSRLSSLRTLNLHNNLISSEGEGDNGRRPSPPQSLLPSPSPARSVGRSAAVPSTALC